MALKIPDEGEEVMLGLVLAVNMELRLFKNDHTPADADTEADYTEATFSGYAAATLTGGSWTITPGAPTLGSYAQQTFESDADQSAQTIYGYYVVYNDGVDDIVMWAERLTAPKTIQNAGDQIKITPRLTGKDETD